MDLLGFAHDSLVRGGGGLECQRKQQTPDAYELLPRSWTKKSVTNDWGVVLCVHEVH